MDEKLISIYSLPISARAKTSLFLHGIKNLEDIRQYTPEELRQLPDIGIKSVEDIMTALKAADIQQADVP